MSAVFLVPTPRAGSDLFRRIITDPGKVSSAGESCEFLARLRQFDQWQAEPPTQRAWRHTAAPAPAWGDSLRELVKSWAGGDPVHVLRDGFTGRNDWRAAVDHWSWMQSRFPDSKIVFLTRDVEETEISLEFTWPLWIPHYGSCVGNCMRNVREHRQHMADFHAIHPDTTALLEYADLSDFDTLAGKLEKLALPVSRRRWKAAIRQKTATYREMSRTLQRVQLPPSEMRRPPSAELRPTEGAVTFEHHTIELTDPEPATIVPLLPDTFRLPLPETPAVMPSTIVYTLRFGKAQWLTECVPTLASWCHRHGLPLQVVTTWPEEYPNPKFVYVDLLREFLAGTAERVLFIDADVFIHPLAPAMPLDAPGVHTRADIPTGAALWHQWTARHYPGEDFSAHTCRQAGIWACDRETARMILAEADAGPFIKGMMEQHQWNVWLARAAGKGMPIVTLPNEWNSLSKFETRTPAWFIHLAGGKKERTLENVRGQYLLPSRPAPLRRNQVQPEFRAIVYPWKSSSASWEELRYSLRSLSHFKDRHAPIILFGDKPPAWLRIGGRIEFKLAAEYTAALIRGLQSADDVLWMNDDIFLLKPCGWKDFETAVHYGPMLDRARQYLGSKNSWQRELGRVAIDLHHYGAEEVLNFSTHTPYRFRRDRAIETLRAFAIRHKTPFETLYHNHHATPAEECGNRRATGLPIDAGALFLNVTDSRLNDEMKAEIAARFPDPAPWEIV